MVVINRFISIIFALVFLTGCSFKPEHNFSEVDINQKLPVQIQYRQKLYNGEIFLDNTKMIFKVLNNDSVVDGIIFTVSGNDCTLQYDEIQKTITRKKSDDFYLPFILYDFLLSFGGVIRFNALNENDNTQYVTKSVNEISVTLVTDDEGLSGRYKIIIK